MTVHKRDTISFSPPPNTTVWDVASKVRILSGQKLIIQHEGTTLATYNNCNEIERDRSNPALKRTADFIGWLGAQLVIYVGEEI